MSLSPTPTVVTDAPADSMIPRPEYPRPDRDRSDRWLTLNGQWDFSADGIAAPITVPFAWESEASGIHQAWLERGEYRRMIQTPADWTGSRILLCFGAVHHRAVVRVDGSVVGEHVGGYESFEIDITDHVTPGTYADLTVEVDAPADKRSIPHGKQRSIPRDDYDGVAFTPTSGIWQSVWVEARGSSYAETIELRGDSLTGINIAVSVAGVADGAPTVTARLVGTQALVDLVDDEGGQHRGRIEVDEPRLWSPDDPYLYRVEVTVDDEAGARDRVVATTGLRRIEVRGERLYLNDARFFMRGVLDQGYWPDTGLTAPDDDALRRDIHLARELGYNLVRKHLKFEEPLWLHEADVSGMLVWAEPACPSRFSLEAADAFEAQLPAMVERDGNHPSIVIWGLYNEEWGLDWDIPGSPARAEAAVRAYDRLLDLDNTRPIVENSGWSHVKSDIVDWHYYEPNLATWKQAVADIAAGTRESFPVRLAPDFTVDKSLYGSENFPRHGVPIVNGEYGEGFTSLERAWHLRWETQEMRRHDRFAGYVYTEFADVEHENAGLLTTDRRAKEWGGCIPSDVNAETVLVLDIIPLAAGADIEPPTSPLVLDVHVSHHGARDLNGRVHAAWVRAGAPVIPVPDRPSSSSGIVRVTPFEISGAVTVDVPPSEGSARLIVWFADDSDTVIARSFLDAAEVESPNRRGARSGEFVDAPRPGIE